MEVSHEHIARNGEEGVSYVVDLDGKRVIVGDRIAYAATDGRSAGLRIGKVIEIRAAHKKPRVYDGEVLYESAVPVKLRVEVQENTGYGKPEKPTLIEAGFKRFVRL